MQVKLKLNGVEQAMRQLEQASKKVDPVLRGALNSTATKSRAQRYVKPLYGTFKSSVLGARLEGADLRGKITVKRAKKGRMNSRLIPSSSGVLVDDYRRWVFEALTPTRGRIYVYGLRGKKVAAGFVNPGSIRQAALSSRNGKKTPAGRPRLGPAIGPSAAYWFKQLTTNQTIRWVNAYLQQEFAKRMRKELSR